MLEISRLNITFIILVYCVSLLISSKHNVLQKLMGMSLVLQDFDHKMHKAQNDLEVMMALDEK